MTSSIPVDPVREKILTENRKKLIEHKEISTRLKGSMYMFSTFYVILFNEKTLEIRIALFSY